MKGITLLSDLFLLLILIVEVIIIVGLVWVFEIIYGVESRVGITQPFNNPREVILNVLFKPVKYESALLAFLELDCKSCEQRISMKDILNAVAIQGKKDVWLNGESIDAEEVSKELLDELLELKPYLLKTREPQIIIAQSTTLPAQLQKVSTNLFLLDGAPIDLELYVG